MAQTKAILGRAALAFGLSMAAAAAHAVPIVFEFTGTVIETRYFDFVNQTNGIDLSQAGQTVTGRMVVETEGLIPSLVVDASGTRYSYGDVTTDPIEQITSELSIGGVAIDVSPYSGHGGGVGAFEASGLPTCEGCSRDYDRLTVTDTSLEYWLRDGVGNPPPPPGQYSSHFLSLGWADPNGSPDFLDLSHGFEPLDLIELVSALRPGMYYSTSVSDCADRLCTSIWNSQTNFNITSLTVSTPSVPEPGTLALFGVGLLGSAVARRSLSKSR